MIEYDEDLQGGAASATRVATRVRDICAQPLDAERFGLCTLCIPSPTLSVYTVTTVTLGHSTKLGI